MHLARLDYPIRGEGMYACMLQFEHICYLMLLTLKHMHTPCCAFSDGHLGRSADTLCWGVVGQIWSVPHPPRRGSFWLGTQPRVHGGFHAAWLCNGLREQVLERLTAVVSQACAQQQSAAGFQVRLALLQAVCILPVDSTTFKHQADHSWLVARWAAMQAVLELQCRCLHNHKPMGLILKITGLIQGELAEPAVE